MISDSDYKTLLIRADDEGIIIVFPKASTVPSIQSLLIMCLSEWISSLKHIIN